MSEIWTPGDDKKDDKPKGGIELPKGFSTRRRREEKTREEEQEDKEQEKDEQEEIAASIAAAQAAAGPAAGVGPQTGPIPQAQPQAPAQGRPRQGQQMDFLFPPTAVQVQCPGCGNPFQAPVFSIVDLGANPELRQALLGGQINLARCPNCGAGGALSAPLMVHDPDNEFLGILIPRQAQLDDMQTQKIIGEMSQALLDRLDTEKRKGYMLQPKEYYDWDSFLEKFWEFEGVSPEELRQQREQGELVNSLVRISDDQDAMRMAVQRRSHLIDENFFVLLGQVMQALSAQGEEERLENIRNLRQHLMNTTEAGSQVKALEDTLREAMQKIRPQMGRDELLDVLLEYWRPGSKGERVVATLLSVNPGLADYEFLMTIANRLDRTQDDEQRADLISLRDLIVELNEQQTQGQQAMVQQAQQVLQDVLQAKDVRAKLEEHEEHIDELFLSLLASNIKQAEQNNATFAVRRLRDVYEKAMSMMEEKLPEDVRLLNQLLTAPDEATTRQLLKENRSLLSQEFVDALSEMERRARSDGSEEIAERIKRLRGQVKLML